MALRSWGHRATQPSTGFPPNCQRAYVATLSLSMRHSLLCSTFRSLYSEYTNSISFVTARLFIISYASSEVLTDAHRSHADPDVYTTHQVRLLASARGTPVVNGLRDRADCEEWKLPGMRTADARVLVRQVLGRCVSSPEMHLSLHTRLCVLTKYLNA